MPNNPFIVIGVDFSTERIDFSVWDGDEKLLTYSSIERGKSDLYHWLAKFRQKLEYWNTYGEDRYGKKYLAIDDIYHKNAKTTKALPKVAGAIEYIALGLGFEFMEVSNDTWTTAIGCKRFHTSCRIATQYARDVHLILSGESPLYDHNIADAINIGAYAVRKINPKLRIEESK